MPNGNIGPAGIVALFIPLLPFPGFMRILILALSFLTTWLGVATAHKVYGWRTALLPILAFLMTLMGVAVLLLLLGGASYTVEALLHDIGIEGQ